MPVALTNLHGAVVDGSDKFSMKNLKPESG